MTPPAMPTAAIPGIPALSQVQLERLVAALPNLHRVWFFRSRAMGRHQQGSDIDLCLDGQQISHQDRLRLLTAIENLLLPWRVDLVLRHELPPELLAHLDRVGRCIWCQPGTSQVCTMSH